MSPVPTRLGPRLACPVLAAYALWLVVAYRYHFLDGVNLVFHEAGHLAFGLFGTTAHFLGGTLGQLVFPVACAGHFLRRGQRFEAAVCGLWGAESLMYVATYLGDARAQSLPLVGGHVHDWAWLLGRWGLVAHCETLAAGLHALASAAALGFVGWAAREAFAPGRTASAGEASQAARLAAAVGRNARPRDLEARAPRPAPPSHGAAVFGRPDRSRS